jgi:hypothetical protein
MISHVKALALVFVTTVSTASAQTPGNPTAASAAPTSPWSVRASAAVYVMPDDDDYVQPTVAVDRGALHLESRYNYEDRNSLSGFIGWNAAVGSTVTLEVTPMFGGVVGDTNGIVPALALTLSFRRFELYSEGEYVIDLGDRSDPFLYNWSEASVWATDWLRAGLVTQRTRTIRERRENPREIERGALVGLSLGKFDGAFYLFNPGSGDSYVVASFGVTF